MTADSLATSLQTNLTAPARWQALLRCLSSASVWVPVMTSSTKRIFRWQRTSGEQIVPVFTSSALMQQRVDARVQAEAMQLAVLSAEVRGTALWLNPGEITNIILAPDTVAALAEPIRGQLVQPEIIEGNRRLMVSTVQAPQALTDALTAYFVGSKTVRRAYIAQIQEAATDTKNLLIALEAQGDIATLIQSTGEIAVTWLAEGESIEVCLIDANDPGLGHYFTAHFTPFYQRRWGSFLRDSQITGRII